MDQPFQPVRKSHNKTVTDMVITWYTMFLGMFLRLLIRLMRLAQAEPSPPNTNKDQAPLPGRRIFRARDTVATIIDVYKRQGYHICFDSMEAVFTEHDIHYFFDGFRHVSLVDFLAI